MSTRPFGGASPQQSQMPQSDKPDATTSPLMEQISKIKDELRSPHPDGVKIAGQLTAISAQLLLYAKGGKESGAIGNVITKLKDAAAAAKAGNIESVRGTLDTLSQVISTLHSTKT